ncbi:hypothetical protein [Shewanella sp. HN-41]|uniref:hypothetical protein n=1 Tax=Shewanella sp. HN-41 TaxID=327275 RepID=UPI00021266E0|nr:hypothetical protein [Shewanella sp. HN-41]EGM70822.1 putative lipoprotein [Shewanella sp. HN-41]
MNKNSVSWAGAALAFFALTHVITNSINKQDIGLSPEQSTQMENTLQQYGPKGNGSQYGQYAQADDTNLTTDNSLENVHHIYSNKGAFAALRQDGSVVTWGDRQCGGDHSAVAGELVNVKTIFASANRCGFAALTQDHRLVIWDMGDAPSLLKDKLTQVADFVMHDDLFAAIKRDGSVISWSIVDGSLDELTQGIYSAPEMKDVLSVSINDAAFAALKQDGTVVTWGSAYHGGDSHYLAAKLKDIKAIYAGPSAFTAVTQNGELISWGSVNGGQESQDQVDKLSQFTSALKVFPNEYGFAALMADGRVYAWGEDVPSESRIDLPLELTLVPANSQDKVIDIVSNSGAYAALKANGQVVAWGHKFDGGDASTVQHKLQQVRALYAMDTGFVALREDGTSIAWRGEGFFGSEPVIQEVASVVQIATLERNYAALKADGTVVDGTYGPRAGITEAVELIPSVVGFTVKRRDGSIAGWQGEVPNWNIVKQDVDLSNLIEIRGNISGMIALTSEGKVLSWNMIGDGGAADPHRLN